VGADAVTTENNGTVNITNSGLLDIKSNANMTLDGAFLQDGTGNNQIAANILTSGDQITFTSATKLTGPVSLNSTNAGFPAGAAISFMSTLDGNNNLTINSGLAGTLFNDKVGSLNLLGTGTGAALTLNSKGLTTFNGALNAQSGVVAQGP